MDQSLLGGMRWRLIGPFRGGRVPAVAGHPTEVGTFYFGACAGGVWKSTDGGAYWQNISDGYFTSASIGAIAIADADPNVIYVGTGETSIRGNVVHGDGVYKSTDGGRSWTNVGLRDTHAIGAVRVHPKNPDIVYVAALGHVWGPNAERGVFRSKDGGLSWEKVLFVSERAGAVDLTMDPNNPRNLYAAIWQAQRYPHQLVSGGEDSGIWRSTDGGDSWEDLTRKPGLPKGVLGKIGVAVSPARTGRVWALVEAEDGALFRSDDGGETWERLSELGDLRRRAWYYTHVVADPSDENTVWVMNLKCWKSVDGGRTFSAIPTPHGDNQDLWIDPRDSNRMIQGNDGGANVSFNGGLTWSSIYNQPTAQFYHVTTDNRTPYLVYGSQQDNTALAGPSSSARGAITLNEWFEPGGGESGYIAVKPTNENIVYGGAIGSGAGPGRLIRFNRETLETRIVTVWPEVIGSGRGAESLRYRFQWTFPITFSPHDPDTLYVTSQHIHRSTDDGMSWEVVSPDLTVGDPETLKPSGGPITRDNSGAEIYGTIFAFVPSQHEPSVFWTGSDDGLIHVSKDGLESWENVSIPGLPPRALISVIEQSPHDPATVYVAATRYKHDDFRPYLFKSNDYGATWTQITDGIPEHEFTRVIREDPLRRGLLFAGTETGLYVSFDDGAHWERFQLNLPVVPIHDVIVKDDDLVAATHGRSFWILDDISPLRQLDTDGGAPRLLAPSPALRFRHYGRMGDPSATYLGYGRFGGMMGSNFQRQGPNGEWEVEFLDAGKNPPDGAVIYYWLPDTPQGELALTIRDAQGNLVRRFTSKAEKSEQAEGAVQSGEGDEAADTAEDAPAESLKAPAERGLNRFIWNLRYANSKAPEGAEMAPDLLLGPTAVPGQYSVELSVNGQTLSQPLEVRADPRVAGTQDDLQAQFDLLLRIRDKQNQLHAGISRLRRIRSQAESWQNTSDDEGVKKAGKALTEGLAAIEEPMIQPKSGDPRQFPVGLNDKLAALPGMIANADTRPPKQYYEVFDKLAGEIDEQLRLLDEAVSREVAAFNDAVKNAGVMGITA